MEDRVDKISIDNSFKIVQFALDFTKNGKEFVKVADEDKKSNFSKLCKLSKKIIPVATVTKLMKLSVTDLDRRRQNSLKEFVLIIEKLKQRVLNGKEQDPKMADDIKQFIQEGHMILAAVILHEMHVIMSMYEADNSSVSKPNLVRLLKEVKNYCESVNTMKFPPEWENFISDLSKKTPSTPTGNGNVKPKALQSPKREAENDGSEKEGEGSQKEKEDSEEGDNETHTVQIEIRGNTGGFVGSTIEFDLVVTHEDGSPVKVYASDFAVEIHGPAANSPVNITSKGKDDGAFRIEFVPKEPGANTLAIYMHNTLLTSGIKSIISKAGETAYLIHAKDISKGHLQGISVVPSSSNKNLSRAEVLKLKLDDIASAMEMLESLRAKTLTEIETLGSQ